MPIVANNTEYLIDTSNAFEDIISNIIAVINREIDEDTEQELTYIKRRMDIFDHDAMNIPNLPALAFYPTTWNEEIRTMGKTNVTVKMDVNIDCMYYHEILSRKADYKTIVKAMWELSRILRRNSDLNGLSRLGMQISSGGVTTRARMNGIYAGGYMRLLVPIVLKTRRAIS